MIDARFGHVNVIARDWQRLADFYKEVFGMEVVPPLRDYRGPDLANRQGLLVTNGLVHDAILARLRVG